MSTKTKKLGFVAAKPIPQVLRNINAFTLGARSVDPTHHDAGDLHRRLVDAGQGGRSHQQPGRPGHRRRHLPRRQPQGGGRDRREARPVHDCGYHASQAALAPKGYLTGAEWNWEAALSVVRSTMVQAGKTIPDLVRGGLKAGIVKTSRLYGAGARRGAQARPTPSRRKFMGGGFVIFKGPIKDNKGNESSPPAPSRGQTDIELEKMSYLVEGVIGATSLSGDARAWAPASRGLAPLRPRGDRVPLAAAAGGGRWRRSSCSALFVALARARIRSTSTQLMCGGAFGSWFSLAEHAAARGAAAADRALHGAAGAARAWWSSAAKAPSCSAASRRWRPALRCADAACRRSRCSSRWRSPACVAGGVWIALGGRLRHWRGVNETISSLLLSYIAIALLNQLVEGPLRDPASLNKPSTPPLRRRQHDRQHLPGIDVHWGLASARRLRPRLAADAAAPPSASPRASSAAICAPPHGGPAGRPHRARHVRARRRRAPAWPA